METINNFMTKTTKKEIVRFDSSMKPAIRALLKTIGNDGHTVWKPSILKGFSEGIRSRFVRTIKSNKKDYKQTIFDNNGNAIDEMEGIYGLGLLGTICNDLGLDYESKIGRGFQARCYTESIQQWLKKPIRKKRVISSISSGMEDTMYPSDDNSYCGIK